MDKKSDKRTRIPICPREECGEEITHKGSMFGQASYVCKSCNCYGPWAERKTIRNPMNPKRKNNNVRKG
jgi:hypothetical protein